MTRILCLIISMCLACEASAADKLLQASDMTYLGAFKPPSNSSDALDWISVAQDVGKGMAYNPAGNGGAGSLFMVGHFMNDYVGELAIPSLYTGTTEASLPTASILQPLADITEGNRSKVDAGHATYTGGGSVQISGLGYYAGNLFGGVYATYNGAEETVYTMFKHSATVSTPSFAGMYQLGPSPSVVPSAGYTGGYMGIVPSAWRSALGGSIMTGNGYTSVISQTSAGASLFTFDPANVTGVNTSTVSSSAVLYYPGNDASKQTAIGAWGGESTQYHSMNDRITGVVFPEGSRSVLFFGRHGSGSACYGVGTSDPSQAKTAAEIAVLGSYTCGSEVLVGAANACCYDRSNHDHGTHSYPYHYQVWAYDANDLAAVKAGTKHPWEPVPYAMWELPLKFNRDATESGFLVGINGATYDSANQRVLVTQGLTGIVQVFQLNLSDSTPTITSGIHIRANRVKAHVQ